MFKRITRGPLRLKIWTDGSADPIRSATHVAIRTNVPNDPEFESETDHYVIEEETNTAWMYAKGFVTRHGDHNHTQFVPVADDQFNVADGDDAGKLSFETITDLLAEKGLTNRVGSIDRLVDDLGVDLPRSMNDFGVHLLDGYGFHADREVPVFVFVAPEDAPVPVLWEPPITHVVNYSAGDSKEEAVQRFGVMGFQNQIIGGWSGKTGFELVKRLTKHGEYEVAVRPIDSMPDITHAIDYEPRFLGEIEYGDDGEDLMQVDESEWGNYENDEGVTAMDMWAANHS